MAAFHIHFGVHDFLIRLKKFLDRKLVRFGSFRRLSPMSRVFGYDRGPQSVGRYYIDKFIAEHSADIHGHVLEVAERKYTQRHGGNRVTKSDVLHVWPDNPVATIVADLTKADEIASDSFDCLILTGVLQCIYDFRAALKHSRRILKPNGVLLATMSGISQISRPDMDRWGEYWRFTTASAQLLFEEFFPRDHLEVKAHGNVFAAMALLYGLSSRELRKEELEFHDRDYEVQITVRAVKPASGET